METNASSIFEEIEPQIVLASQGKRFLNYIIDQAAFYGFMFLFWTILSIMGIYFPFYIFGELDSLSFKIIDRIISLFFYALFMGFIEAIFRGKTLGKLITQTRAVNEDGSQISAATAFKRGFSRAVPFCAFSALGNPSYPWQDRWTNTYVMDEKLSEMNPSDQY